MRKLYSGSFFRYPIDAVLIINFLKDKYSLEVSGSINNTLDGTCDSRNGGNRQLVFSTLEDFKNIQIITQSLVLIDELPAEAEQENNQFCKVDDPRSAFIEVLSWLILNVGIDAHQRGFTEEASISKSASIEKTAVIESGVEIGSGSIISAGAVIKTGTRIGENTVIRENAVIGSDGITVYRAADGRLLKFPHVGGVFIGSNTEIGSNAVVAGGILAPTHIDNNVVIGNLCNVGHGVVIENGVWISVGSLIGGHSTIHTGATIAMGVTVRDNLIIGEEASLGMGSVVVRSVEAKHSMFGNPAKRMIGLKTGPKR